MASDDSKTFNYVVVGDAGCGKTSLISALTMNWGDDWLYSEDIFAGSNSEKGFHFYNVETGEWDVEKTNPIISHPKTFGCWNNWTHNNHLRYNVFDVNGCNEKEKWWRCKDSDFLDCVQNADGAVILFDHDPDSAEIVKTCARLFRVVGNKIPYVIVRTKCDDAVPGEVSQDGIVYASALKNVNVKLAFRILNDDIKFSFVL